MQIGTQIYWLVILSIVVSSIAWTVTQEEIFAEPRKFASDRSENAKSIFIRKFFYVFTCEYCFSHWVTLFVLMISDFRLLFSDRRGLLISFFTIPWLANQLMSAYRRLRVGIKHENALAEVASKDSKN